MKKLKLITILFVAFYFVACGGNITETRKPKKQENSRNPLADSTSDFGKSNGSSGASPGSASGGSSEESGVNSGGTTGGGTTGGGTTSTGTTDPGSQKTNCTTKNTGILNLIEAGKNSLKAPFIALSFEYKNKALWLLHDSGTSFYRAKKWTHFTSKAKDYPDYPMEALHTSQGIAWIGGPFGIYKYDGSRWDVVSNYIQVTALHYSVSSKYLWVGTQNGQIMKEKNSQFDFVRRLGNLNNWGNDINVIFEQNKNEIFFATDKGVLSYNNLPINQQKYYDHGKKQIIAKAFAHDTKNLWAAGSKSLQKFVNNDWQEVLVAGKKVLAKGLVFDGKNLWALSDNALLKRDAAGKWQSKALSSAFSKINKSKSLILNKTDKILWLLAEKVIYEIDIDCYKF